MDFDEHFNTTPVLDSTGRRIGFIVQVYDGPQYVGSFFVQRKPGMNPSHCNNYGLEANRMIRAGL